MAHVAFFTPASAGHVNPSLGLAAELTRRGHEVTFVTTDEFAARVQEVSTSVVRYQERFGEGFRTFRFTGRSLLDAMVACLRETRALVPELKERFSANPPDVVVYDNGAWWGRLLAESWGVPSVQVNPMLVSNEHWSMGDGYAKLRAWSPRLWRFFGDLNKLLREVGTRISAKDLLTGAGEARRLVFIPRAFQFRGETFDETFQFVGPCLHERKFLGTWQRPHEDGPLLLVTLGTIYNLNPEFFRTCMRAVEGLGGHVVIAVGDGIDPESLGTPPANVEVRRFVAQLDVLKHADLFISHAGMGSTMESLTCGVPMLVAPQMAEEQANADRLVELGAARMLPADGLTAETMRAAIDAALADEGIRRRARELRDEIRAAGGAAAAADSVEAALAAGRAAAR
jgi:demethyllactenocin mycarosyltransferase